MTQRGGESPSWEIFDTAGCIPAQSDLTLKLSGVCVCVRPEMSKTPFHLNFSMVLCLIPLMTHAVCFMRSERKRKKAL